MSAMTDMSQAIREQIEQHGPTLKDVPFHVLLDLTTIIGAFHMDMRAELDRRGSQDYLGGRLVDSARTTAGEEAEGK